jgi:hypothetical protein
MTSSIVAGRLGPLRRAALLSLFLLPQVSEQLIAKTAGLTAIVVYPSSTGMSYEQISGFILNSKNEVYVCPEAAQWDKSEYHKLTKVVLSPGMSLERNAKGVLMLTQESGPPACVVPGNLKLDKGDALTPSSLADKAAIEGSVLPASDPPQTPIVPLKAGVKIVIVAAPNQELAEFLRGDKAGDIPGWEAYLKKYDGGPHTAAARKALAQLYVRSANAAFADYGSSKGKDAEYAKLKSARQFTDKAKTLVPDFKDALALSDQIHAEVVEMGKAALQDLNLYRTAIEQQKPGYSNLPDAEKLAQNAIDIEPATSEGIEADKQAKQAREKLERILKDSEGLIAQDHPDDAEEKIKPLLCFSKEVTRISDDVHAISALYIGRARKREGAEKWPEAVSDLTKADELLPGKDTHALLEEAQQKAHDAAVKAAADEAMQKSTAFESSGDIINAFEVLDNLPKESHALVSQRLSDLQAKYVSAAEDAAKNQQKAHEPISGLTDEVGIQKAYDYLQRCYQLTNDPSLRDRVALLADELSAYYLQQGTKYAEKPEGIGVNVGWTYLNEALQYRSTTNSSAARDERERARPKHLLKSKLSVKVDFRDGTSRRASAQFADQLDEALASGLESSGYQIKIVRNENTVVPANFQLIGDVLEHDMTPLTQNIPKQSKFVASEEQIPNDAWTELNREIEKINRQLDTERSQLEGAEARGKKKEVSDAKSAIDQDSTKVEQLQTKLDRIPKTISQPVIRDYTYTEVVHKVVVTVDLQFHILDSSGSEIASRMPIHKEKPTSYSVLENVKPEDTQGVKNDSIIPDENKFFEQTENEARDALISEAKKKINELPGIVLSTADRKAANGDSDGAAELYILYLNCTPVADTPERRKAQGYLADNFNFKDIGKTQPED